MTVVSPGLEIERIRGCLLGGAVGDALGWPVEFQSLGQIRRTFGTQGVTAPVESPAGVFEVSDDTQMTLFTAEGILRARRAGYPDQSRETIEEVSKAYGRWLYTQGFKEALDPSGLDGWLIEIPELFNQRAPGQTCLGALLEGRAYDDSKGCGGIMRVAPVGLLHDSPMVPACLIADITHGHPTGYLSAGCFALIIRLIAEGATVQEAARAACDVVIRSEGSLEVAGAIHVALELAGRTTHPGPSHVESLGAGWVAEEALAIALFCSLKAGSFEEGVLLAVNHSGDSDSTGALTGSILGCLMGPGSIPSAWLEKLELRLAIERIAGEIASCREL
ncbi:ADP-ribosylglycohydrolase family protein [Candidatus Fermentibacterales bacterium]|nr:ADP-ribosylglycohydrolase family protein [Candidatus Fermentibacterales bacterium]